MVARKKYFDTKCLKKEKYSIDISILKIASIQHVYIARLTLSIFFKTFENKIICEILLLISFDMELSFKIALETGNVTRDFHVCEILFIAVMSYIFVISKIDIWY